MQRFLQGFLKDSERFLQGLKKTVYLKDNTPYGVRYGVRSD